MNKRITSRIMFAVGTADLSFKSTTLRTSPRGAALAYMSMHPGNRWTDLVKDREAKVVAVEVRLLSKSELRKRAPEMADMLKDEGATCR